MSGPERADEPRTDGGSPRRATTRPDRAPDDSDIGWGERLTDPDDDDRRYLEDRPPHWAATDPPRSAAAELPRRLGRGANAP